VLFRPARDIALVHVMDVRSRPAIFLTISMVSLQVAHPALKISILCFIDFFPSRSFESCRQDRTAGTPGPAWSASYSKLMRR
jgi:hypothetical protein